MLKPLSICGEGRDIDGNSLPGGNSAAGGMFVQFTVRDAYSTPYGGTHRAID